MFLGQFFGKTVILLSKPLEEQLKQWEYIWNHYEKSQQSLQICWRASTKWKLNKNPKKYLV